MTVRNEALMLRRLRPLLSAAVRSLAQPSVATHSPNGTLLGSSLLRPTLPPAPAHRFLLGAPVSGTPKGKARLKSIVAAKKFKKNKDKGGSDDKKGAKGRFQPVKHRRVIDRLNTKLRRREAVREKLGLVSKLRTRDLEVQKVKSEAAKADPEDGPTIMGLQGMTLPLLGLVDIAAVPKYRLTVEDGRVLAKDYSRLLMMWNRQRHMAETQLMELRKKAIEALPDKLKRAALLPLPLKKNAKEDAASDKKKTLGKGKGRFAREKGKFVPGKKAGGKPAKKG